MQGSCLAFVCMWCWPWRCACGSPEAALGPLQTLTGAGALLPSGTEEADGGAGPDPLLPRGGGNAPHSDPDYQGAAAEQRHRRTLQGPGSHAAEVGWRALEHRALAFPVLDLRHHPVPGMSLQRRCWFQRVWAGFSSVFMHRFCTLKKGRSEK